MSMLPAKMDVKAAAVRWEPRLEDLRSQKKNLGGDLLQYRHDVGRLVIEIIEKEAEGDTRSPYGKGLVKHLIAPRLGESADTIYKMIQFAHEFPPEKLRRFREAEYSWGSVVALLPVRNEGDREQLMQDFEAGEYESGNQFRTAVKKHSAEQQRQKAERDVRGRKPRFKPGAGEILGKVRSLNMVLGRAVNPAIPEYLSGLKQLMKDRGRFNPTTVQKIEAELREAAKIVSALGRLYPRLKEDTAIMRAKEVKVEVVGKAAKAG